MVKSHLDGDKEPGGSSAQYVDVIFILGRHIFLSSSRSIFLCYLSLLVIVSLGGPGLPLGLALLPALCLRNTSRKQMKRGTTTSSMMRY